MKTLVTTTPNGDSITRVIGTTAEAAQIGIDIALETGIRQVVRRSATSGFTHEIRPVGEGALCFS